MKVSSRKTLTTLAGNRLRASSGSGGYPPSNTRPRIRASSNSSLTYSSKSPALALLAAATASRSASHRKKRDSNRTMWLKKGCSRYMFDSRARDTLSWSWLGESLPSKKSGCTDKMLEYRAKSSALSTFGDWRYEWQ